MLSIAKVEELFTSTRYGGITTSPYVLFVMDEVESWLEFPSVVSVRPHRHTLFFSSGHPLPLVGPRRPFIPPSLIVDDEE
jgi:hypothetical protein